MQNLTFKELYSPLVLLTSVACGAINSASHRFGPFLFGQTLQSLDTKTKLVWDNRVVSSIHASISALTGTMCAWKGATNPKQDHLVQSWQKFELGYYLYDTLWLFWAKRETGFLNLAVLGHHLLCLATFAMAVLFPISDRRRKLQGFVALTVGLLNCTTPLRNLGWALQQTGKEGTVLWKSSMALFVICFFCFRVLMLPVMAWLYKRFLGLKYFWELPQRIPTKCTVFSVGIWLVNLFWLVEIIGQVKRKLVKSIVKI